MKYNIISDVGNKDVNSDSELRRELIRLKKIGDKEMSQEHDDVFNIEVYDENDDDVTDKMFRKFGLNG